MLCINSETGKINILEIENQNDLEMENQSDLEMENQSDMDNNLIYDTIIGSVPQGENIADTIAGDAWSLVETAKGKVGIAMTTSGSTRPPMLSESLIGMDIQEAARALMSWNFEEASLALAAINACLNTEARMKEFHCKEPYDNYCTRGLDLSGKRLGLIGHLKMPEEVRNAAAECHILELHPQPGDYPASACEWILPECEIVIITGSSLINKTLPRLLALCRNAYTILAGPTVPLCPALLDLGIDRLAGLVINDPERMKKRQAAGVSGAPYDCGQSFLIMR